MAEPRARPTGAFVLGFLFTILTERYTLIEIVDTAENIDRVLPLLDPMVGDGMLIVERVHVIAYLGSAE